jgi:hypothetical protein
LLLLLTDAGVSGLVVQKANPQRFIAVFAPLRVDNKKTKTARRGPCRTETYYLWGCIQAETARIFVHMARDRGLES